MVKQEIIGWRYLLRTQFILFLLPLFLLLLAVIWGKVNSDTSHDLLKFVVFPSMLFPIIGAMGQIGSLHHKELLITYPLNSFLTAFIRPFLLSVLYSTLFMCSIKLTNGFNGEELKLAFASVFFYMNLSALLLVFFKNIALGIILPMVYLFFGIFTTGSGQGFFYLMQWGRANPALTNSDCTVTQLIAGLCFILGAWYFLKQRNKYHWAF